MHGYVLAFKILTYLMVIFGPSWRTSFPRHCYNFHSRMAATREQPPWRQPPAADPASGLPPLRVYNSLTRSKTLFIPIKWETKEVSWYVCGPTVYDDAHLGHARNYLTTDILRRILQDYFKFKVRFVMNVSQNFGRPSWTHNLTSTR